MLVVEDEPFVRGLVAQIVRSSGFDVITAEDASSALATLESFDPDAAIIDIDLGRGPNGIDLADAILLQLPHLALVFLTQVTNPRVINHTLATPTNAAYLNKRALADPQTLIEALEVVLRDGDVSHGFRDDLDSASPLNNLSTAQLETLRLIAEGASNEGIAQARGTSVRAVESMVSRIFSVLELTGDPLMSQRVAAARLYAEHVRLPS